MIGRGRKRQERAGGGVAILLRKKANLSVEVLDVGSSAMSEDIMAVKVKGKGRKGIHDC